MCIALECLDIFFKGSLFRLILFSFVWIVSLQNISYFIVSITSNREVPAVWTYTYQKRSIFWLLLIRSSSVYISWESYTSCCWMPSISALTRQMDVLLIRKAASSTVQTFCATLWIRQTSLCPHSEMVK